MPKHYRPAGKKKEGNAARYITRTHAVKQLQVSLTLFRKLCILKGIFPREPKKKVKGAHHTYYHTKDILFLQHEPLVEKFRDIRAYNKKIKKAEAKRNKERALSLKSRQPTYDLGRLIRERYPKFIDALRDLDDCLSLVHLFAALPAVHREKIEVKRIHTCRRLSHEWQAYISRTHKLRKTFVSVKGIYYQAEVEGQKITWLTPHALQQVVPDDVDYNVMLTFLEFYETLQSSINARLYHSLNLEYPPTLDSRLEALAAELYALSRYIDSSSRASAESLGTNSSEPNQDEVEKKGNEAEESELRLSQLQTQLPSNKPGALMHLVDDAEDQDEDDEDTRECKKLFKNMKFFLSREVPRESLLFVIPAFGGTVSWEGDGAPFVESDQSITCQIVDRPTQGHIFLSREYVQPQWVFDCVNARIILPTEEYMVGRVPPPHLSPFVDNEAEGYTPDYAEKIKMLQAAARNEVLPLPGMANQDLDDPQSLLAEGVKTRAEANEAAERKRKMMLLEKQYHEELKMELQGVQHSSAADVNKKSEGTEVKEDIVLPDIEQVAQDTADMSEVMMSRKKRGLLKSMEIGKKRKQDKVNLLEERKKQLSKETGEQQKQVHAEEQNSGKKKKKTQKSSRH